MNNIKDFGGKKEKERERERKSDRKRERVKLCIPSFVSHSLEFGHFFIYTVYVYKCTV